MAQVIITNYDPINLNLSVTVDGSPYNIVVPSDQAAQIVDAPSLLQTVPILVQPIVNALNPTPPVDYSAAYNQQIIVNPQPIVQQAVQS